MKNQNTLRKRNKNMKIELTKKSIAIIKIEATEKEAKILMGALMYTLHRIEKHNNPAHLLKKAGIKVEEIKKVLKEFEEA